MKKTTTVKACILAAIVLYSANAGAQNTTINNVQIGTDGPASGVNIKANFPAYTGGWARGFSLSNQTNTVPFFEIGALGAATNGAATFTHGYIGTDYAHPFMVFKPNGDVGIGTSSPLGQLHLVGNGLISEESSAVGGRISLRNPSKLGADVSNWTIFNMTGPGYIKGLHFYRYAANGANYGPSVVFGDDGSVKIGAVTTPNVAGYRLYVDQGILTEKVKVAVAGSAQWSDYVFAKDYNLMPLDEVEQFVKKNKHLPNVPSADEMVKEGNDLGKTDAKLLEKIEELTLYIIEMKKENDMLKKDITAMKMEIQNLKK
jgi:trimeric autotransporter adhesin